MPTLNAQGIISLFLNKTGINRFFGKKIRFLYIKFLKKFTRFWFRFNQNRGKEKFEDIIIPIQFFLLWLSTTLWDTKLYELDINIKLKFITLIYGLQLLPLVLLRSALKLILGIESSFLSIVKGIILTVFVCFTFFYSFNDFWSLTLYSGIFTCLLAFYISVEISFLVLKRRLVFRFQLFSLIPLLMGLILACNVFYNLTFNRNLQFFPFLSYGINLTILYFIYLKKYHSRYSMSFPEIEIFSETNLKKTRRSADSEHKVIEDTKKHNSLLIREDLLITLEDKLRLFIEERNYIQNIRLSDLANYLGITLHLTSRYLNHYKRTSFSDFINELRIQDARRLLEAHYTTMNFTDIALATGFESYPAFSRAFKKRMGASPFVFLREIKRKLKKYSYS
ncbi:DNA-binding helix-turn-helix protein [Leptospira borgpetersenii serovar Pomona str. 200901868]|uniref:DNA-binding helix-turn-helix protein n=1 Tax=Leptospira borgpetersenii serovar Pomona str. 200901868 TaxID=1192866 RepID=M6VXS2_LEPBO|nr:DNA-binding helix-turn-helix protein [Leptospira borgpetersenii serovar Pomona str. 200901868]